MRRTRRPLTKTEMGALLAFMIVWSLVSAYSMIDGPLVPMSLETQIIIFISLASAVTTWAALMVTFRLIGRRWGKKE